MADSQAAGNKSTFFIPVGGIEKLMWYQQGIRGVLSKIEVGNCDPELMENIKAVYELLSQLRYVRKVACDDN